MVALLIINRAYACDQHPGYTGGLIVCFVSVPSPPHLVSQFLVTQQGFDVEFGEMSGVAVASPET